jgi:hypothetical protein
MFVSIAQPTILREYPSSTFAKYSQRDQVGMYVMSATRSRSDAPAKNRRSTRSMAFAPCGSLCVITTHLRSVAPQMPFRRIRRATRLRPTRMP